DHSSCERNARRKAEKRLGLNADLKDTHTSHIEPVTSFCLRDANERSIARGTADNRPHAVHVDSQRANDIACAAAGTGGLNKRHVKGEDLLKDAPSSVAIKFVFHYASPVGPNRSVLMRPGSYPNVTRLAAAVSTNGVGPQINVSGLCSTGQATSRSISVSMRRR